MSVGFFRVLWLGVCLFVREKGVCFTFPFE